MKLKEWADKAGVKYLTAYRWFRDGSLPVKAYQTETGTIIVEESESLNSSNTNDAMSLFLKKTVEYSKANSTIEDFAAYILSTFNLKLNSASSEPLPRYSKNKPKSEDIQKHFQQFLKPKGEKPALNMFVDGPETIKELVSDSDKITTEDVIEEISKLPLGYSLYFKKTNSSGASNDFHVSPDDLSKLLLENNQNEAVPETGLNKIPFVPTQKELEDTKSLIKSKKNGRKRK